MPGVNVQSPFGLTSSDSMGASSIPQIKHKARQNVESKSRGTSAVSLIRTAKTQARLAQTHEAAGDLKNALSAWTMAATLARLTMDSAEFKEEKRRPGVLHKEVKDFFDTDASDMTRRIESVEGRLKSLGVSTAEEDQQQTETKAGGSIADRLRALGDNGMSISVSSNKRLSDQLTSPRFPTSPAMSSSTSQHAFVPTHTLGPPSPSSSPPSSPQIDSFRHNFPAIEELDAEDPPFTLPSVPSGIPSVPAPVPSATGSSVGSSGSKHSPTTPGISAAAHFKLVNGIDRPSSTPLPLTPGVGSFASRPASPSKPAIPHKPSNLSSSINSSASKSPIPNSNTCTPSQLHSYMKDHAVLLIDIRHRSHFVQAHIKSPSSSVVCLEESILMRGNVTGEKLEEAMVIAPKSEAAMFGNREKFDLVVMYDAHSQTFTDSITAKILAKVIYEDAVKKILKHVPMLLVGGFEGWKETFGDEVINGDLNVPVTPAASSGLPSIDEPRSPTTSHGLNGIMNGMNGLSTASGSSSSTYTPTSGSEHQVWTPRSRADANPPPIASSSSLPGHHYAYSMDQGSHSRSPAEHSSNVNGAGPSGHRKMSVSRGLPNGSTSPVVNGLMSPTPHSNGSGAKSPMVNGTVSVSSIYYPQFGKPQPQTPSLASQPSNATPGFISPPPQASISPSLTRRRSDFVDQSQEALSSTNPFASSPPLFSQKHHTSSSTSLVGLPSTGPSANTFKRQPIDYPELLSHRQQASVQAQVLRPPPAAATPSNDRPRLNPKPSFGSYPTTSASTSNLNGLQAIPVPPRINSEYPVIYWADATAASAGLKNLGNTCYMNATIQCLSVCVPVARFFIDGRWKQAINYTNELGSKGKLTTAFAALLHEMLRSELRFLNPYDFRRSITHLAPQYAGTDQHDSQEFLSFLLDGIHEDLNRVMVRPNVNKTKEEEEALETMPVDIASAREWDLWRTRNDSLVVDYFQGMFRNRLVCLDCGKTSTTYNVFSILQLPIPNSRTGRIPLQQCLDALFNEEVLEKDDAWDCPRCKRKVRASAQLSLARLPPILLIHLKRFETHGRFSDKIDTFVEFPMRSLDLSHWMPKTADHAGGISKEDPRCQLPPFRYDLFGVTNHFGNLSSGHYTAHVACRGKWMYCDDSSVKEADPRQVVGQKAYVLFYKRTKY